MPIATPDHRCAPDAVRRGTRFTMKGAAAARPGRRGLRGLLWRGAASAMLLTLAACADLAAVRHFGTGAAAVVSAPEPAAAYVGSASVATPYLALPPQGAQQPEARRQQAQAVAGLQASLAGYFGALARLAGEDAYTLEAELQAVSRGLGKLPAGAVDEQALQAGTKLSGIVGRYVLAARQAAEVRALVREGGPAAMQLTARLRSITRDWRAITEQDHRLAINTLDTLARAKDAPLLATLLARDRAAELAARQQRALAAFDALDAALAGVENGHAEMSRHLDELSGPALQQALKQLAADLKLARQQLAELR